MVTSYCLGLSILESVTEPGCHIDPGQGKQQDRWLNYVKREGDTGAGAFELGLEVHTEVCQSRTEGRASRHDDGLCWYLEHHDEDGGE